MKPPIYPKTSTPRYQMNLPRSGSCDNTLDVADPRPPQRSRSYDPDFRAPSSKVGNSDSFLLPLVTLDNPGSLFQSVSLCAAVREAIPIPPSSLVFSLTVFQPTECLK